MEKLLNLLNEYEEKRIKKINADWKLRVKLLFKPYTKEALTNQAYQSVQNEIISKYYWFIKRLVDNKKIDIWYYEYEIWVWRIWDNNEDRWYDKYTDYEKALMLLSIQDNPIEFLISILK